VVLLPLGSLVFVLDQVEYQLSFAERLVWLGVFEVASIHLAQLVFLCQMVPLVDYKNGLELLVPLEELQACFAPQFYLETLNELALPHGCYPLDDFDFE
tara:strand:- start:475 stop:771 length:297 start_codon:yes stop_codon:yes gene_type:complete